MVTGLLDVSTGPDVVATRAGDILADAMPYQHPGPLRTVARAAAAVVALAALGAPVDAKEPAMPGASMILATTTSTQDSGLLEALIPMFEKESGVRVKTVAVGTGAALALGARGEADALLVHAPAAEVAWMARGHGELRLPVMHNEYIIVGPESDPASISGTATATGSLALIARKRASWVSRDDGSGTDILEKRLWREAGHPELAGKSAGVAPPWCIRSGQGMGATLMIAGARRAYTLTDRGTWLAWRDKLRLVELVRGDAALKNEYHVITVHPAKLSAGRIRSAEAAAFARWITGPRAQDIIRTFGADRYGEPLFVPARPPPASAVTMPRPQPQLR